MDYQEKLDELFIDLPEPKAETGNELGAVVSGKLLFVSGALPFAEGKIQHPGRVGIEVRLDNAKNAARIAGVYSIALAKRALGGKLEKIKRVVKVEGFVASGAEFKDHSKVVDGASELFVQIFGPAGKHARTAVGVASLPNNACVEISVMFEIR